MDDQRADDRSPATEAFAAYLSLCERGEAPDFEAYCDARPGLSEELRRIRAGWERAEDVLRPAAASTPASPSERYRILGEVGRGGMGVVLRVRDRELRRNVAMKVLHAERCADRRATSRFLEEAQVAAQLEHPGIVPVYDTGLDAEGRVYYTMPLVRGRDCREVFELARTGAEGWTRPRALQILLRVCEAVAAAHARGVVHRDLKPSNVMVGPHEEVYVVDWGLARVLDRASDEAGGGSERARVESARREAVSGDADSSLGTLAGQVVGTPSYMSPEQARGERIDFRSDVYSAGAMLYLIWSGARPYEGRGERIDINVLLERLLAGPPEPLREVAPDVPAELAAICERAMAHEREERYPDMGALADDLRAFLESRVVSAYRVGAIAELRKWVQRNRPLAAAMGGLLVSLAVGLGTSLVLNARADAQAELAERNFLSALDAVQRMLTRVGRQKLEDAPGLQPLRRELLEDALAMYAELLDGRPDDVALRAMVAAAHADLAPVLNLLGDQQEAVAAHTRAISILEELDGSGIDEGERRKRLGSCRLGRANIRARIGAIAEARKDALDALREFDSAAEHGVDSDRLLLDQMQTLNILAAMSIQHSSRRTPKELQSEVEEQLLRAIAIGEELEARGVTVTTTLVSALVNRGVLLYDQERYPEAEVPLRRAIEVQERDLDPKSREDLVRLSVAQSQLAIALARQEKREAGAMFRRLVETVRQLVRDYPNVPSYRTALSVHIMNLARWTCEQGDHEAAVDGYEQALRAGEAVLAAQPDDIQTRQSLAQIHENLHRCLRDLGRHAKLAERADEVTALGPNDPLGFGRIAARAWAYCAEIVSLDETLPPSERHAQREMYVAETVRRYQAMVEQGYADPEDLEEEWFDPIREHPAVVELAALLEREARR